MAGICLGGAGNPIRQFDKQLRITSKQCCKPFGHHTMPESTLYVSALSLLLTLVSGKCFDPSPAFPVPLWPHGNASLADALHSISRELVDIASAPEYQTSSLSVQLTSNTDTLWTHYQTAAKHNSTRPGDIDIDGDSVYRIASITKTFTVLGILYQHAAGNLSLDDPVNRYVSGLHGTLPWKDITLRSLASQLSGIPRESIQSDVLGDTLGDPTKLGFPPVSKEGLPKCDSFADFTPCDSEDWLEAMSNKAPLFAPNQMSTYSNAAFELLGLVLANVTGMSYEDYLRTAIFEAIGMNSTTLSKPSDDHAVLPVGQWYWDIDEGIHAPTGGIYSSADDMAKYVRYVMTHYNALATGVNWFHPASYSWGMHSTYGMPWEIFRTEKMLKPELGFSGRPVTFVTKSGGVPDYFSRILVMPEYGLGLVVLVGGENSLLEKVVEAVTVPLVRRAEGMMWKFLQRTRAGEYKAVDGKLNSSITFSASPAKGLVMEEFISNGTDVIDALFHEGMKKIGKTKPWYAPSSLAPTCLLLTRTVFPQAPAISSHPPL